MKLFRLQPFSFLVIRWDRQPVGRLGLALPIPFTPRTAIQFGGGQIQPVLLLS